jgi:type I restriction enzyme, S subunit
MKEVWETKTLGEVCEVFADGDWVESKDQSSEGIRLIQTGNVGEGIFKNRSEKARYISEETFKRLRCTEIVEGDCLVSRLPDPVGRSCILPDTGERMITAVDCTILRFNPKQLLPKFFNLYSQSDDYLTTVAKECTGTTRNRISRSNLGQTPIPVPPLPEQQRIVALLDEAFAGLATAKANAEQNLQNARAIFESHLQSVFTPRDGEGWATMKLGDVCDFKGGSQPPKSQFVYEPRPGYVRFLQIRDFASEKHVTYIPETAKNRLCNSDDIMIGRYGASVGKILTGQAGAYNVALIKTIPDLRLLDRTFFFHYLHSRAFQHRLADVASRSAQDGFGKDDIYGFPVPVPSLNDQQKVIQQMEPLSEETQRLTRLYERKLAALEELKKSLLHQAFNGEL